MVDHQSATPRELLEWAIAHTEIENTILDNEEIDNVKIEDTPMHP